MRSGDVVRVLMIVAVNVWMPRPVFGGEDDLSPRVLAYLSMEFATVRVAAERAPVFATTEPDAQILRSVAWAHRLDVDTSRVKGAPAGWIPIKPIGHVRGRKERVPAGWVRRRDIVLPDDYKKVIGCWPVKSVTDVGGDYAAEVTFDLDGSASVKEWGDEERIDKAPPHQSHVHMARSIVSIDDIEGKAGFFISGYRADERRLYPEGGRAEEQQLFPESMLAGCKSVPLLAK